MFIGSSISLNTMMLGTRFTPASLFANGEQGFWLDPSDVANLDWRRNLLIWTQEFENAAWLKSGANISVNAAVAPDGTSTADTMIPTTSSGIMYFQPALAANAPNQTFSVYVKAAGFSWVALGTNTLDSERAYFNLSSGTLGALGSVLASSSIQSVGDGWYRCSFTTKAPIVGTATGAVWAVNGDAPYACTPSGSNGIFIWGAQLELGSVATQYQPITTVEAGTLERFPKATMYVDRGGSTLVTTPGQLVGLRLDKSKQLALGPELVANGDFSAGATGWAPQTGWTVGSGVASVNSALAGTTNLSSTSVVVVAGRTYQITYTILSVSGSGIRATIGGVTEANFRATTGTFTALLTATSTASFGLVAANNNTVGSIDNVSVKEIAGNHALAISDATRGTYGIEPYGGRRNLLLQTEDLSASPWTTASSGVVAPVRTANSDIAPNGTRTATKLDFPAVSGTQFSAATQLAGTGLALLSRVGSVWLKASSSGDVGKTVFVYGQSQGGQVSVILTAEWQRVNTLVIPADTTATLVVSSIGSGIGGLNQSALSCLAWGAQLEASTTATPYQRVTTEWDVTEAGVPTVYYVQYDNDAYVTPTINPSLNPPLGPELVVSSNGEVRRGSVAPDVNYSPGASVVAGRTYSVTYTISNNSTSTSSASWRVNLVGGQITIPTVAAGFNGTVTGSYLASASGTLSLNADSPIVNFTISNVSIKELVTDKVQVFAGVRKLSDAATGLLIESSTSIFSFPGSFNVLAPSGAFPNYQFTSGGTAITGAVATPYAAPISNVLTGLGDISADRATIRINGTQVAQSTADQGTGNYGAYPIYIGARGGSSLFFSGRDYGIITRFGPNLTNTTILDTEEWLGNKTGVLYVLWNGVWQDQYTWVDNLNWNDGV